MMLDHSPVPPEEELAPEPPSESDGPEALPPEEPEDTEPVHMPRLGLGWSKTSHAPRPQPPAPANALSHPHGPYAPTPDEAWAQAGRVTPEERQHFMQTLADARHEVMMERALTSEDLIDRAARASVDRAAIRQTLVRLGYLCLRRGRISSHIYAGRC
jgi:hypothetical protein